MPDIQSMLSSKICLINGMAMSKQYLETWRVFGQFLEFSHDPSKLQLVSRARRNLSIECPTDVKLFNPSGYPRRGAAYEEHWTARR